MSREREEGAARTAVKAKVLLASLFNISLSKGVERRNIGVDSRGYPVFARSGLASSRAAGALAATSEATWTSMSTSTADGVPVASKARRTSKFWSSIIGEKRSIASLASSVPTETTSSLGVPFGERVSYSFRLGSICWHKPYPGFQKSPKFSSPLKSARSTCVPVRSGSLRGGAGSPSFRPAGTAYPSAGVPPDGVGVLNCTRLPRASIWRR